MDESYIDSIKAMYDERSAHYDDSFHVRLAQDYIKFAKLQEGEMLLDLACGTGLVSLLAKKEVGGRGYVVGVDISRGMLDIARRKSERDALDVEFIECDISDLKGLKLLPEESKGFDVITCAAALVLMKSPVQAVKHWASLLAPGGRLITDIAAQDASIATRILDDIGSHVGQSLRWDPIWATSGEPLEMILIEAGLTVDQIIVTEPYEAREYDINAGSQIFEKAIASPMLRNFGKDTIRKKAKALFIKKFTEMAGSNRVVHEDVRMYIGIASKDV